MNYIYINKFKSTKTVFSEIQARSVGELPIRFSDNTNAAIKIVDAILGDKREDINADTTALEAQIDKMVYELYGLTDEEIKIVEGNLNNARY
jgi:adenine-specific DNA-methyltransferase